MLESHHIISSLISPVTISRSRYWPRVQLSFEHFGLSYSKVNYFSKTGNVSASGGIDNCAQTFTSLATTDLRRLHHLRCHDRWWCNTLHLRHKICSDSLQGTSQGVPPRLKPSALLLAVSLQVGIFATEKRPIWTVKSRSGRSLVSDGVSRRVSRPVFWSLGLEGLRSCLGLGREGFRPRSRALRLETLRMLFFMRFCKELL